MQEATSVRVAKATRDAVRVLADDDGLTLDEEIQRLARSERQRRMGEALATVTPADDEAWLELSASEAADDARR